MNLIVPKTAHNACIDVTRALESMNAALRSMAPEVARAVSIEVASALTGIRDPEGNMVIPKFQYDLVGERAEVERIAQEKRAELAAAARAAEESVAEDGVVAPSTAKHGARTIGE